MADSTQPKEHPIPFSRPVTPNLTQNHIAWVGLGEMGRRMATNLAKALSTHGVEPLIVWNRSPEGIDKFKKWAAEHDVKENEYRVVTDLAEVVKEANVIFTSVLNDTAVRDVYGKLYAAQEKCTAEGTSKHRARIFVDTSSTYPTTAGDMERAASSKPGRSFLAMPVFGVPRAAERADLILAIAGDYFAKKVVAHTICPGIGKKVMDLGSNVEKAASFKLVGNSLELGFIELLSECFTLCDQTGVGSDKLVELIRDQHASPALVRYSERISKNKFDSTGGFNLGGGIADAKHIRQLADANNVPMPTIDVAHQHMITARAVGGESMDWTALVAGERIACGLAPFAGKTRLEPYDGPDM